MKKTVTVILAFILAAALCSVSAQAEEAGEYELLGKQMPDFTVETIDGGTFTLSEALKSHDMVLINLWATWCGPCGMEFPYLAEAYEQYKDRVAVIALSVEEGDTPEILRRYAAENGLTFPVGSDTQTGLNRLFATGGIPTTVVVDRFGNVALAEVGARNNTISFTALFDYFLDPDYTETTLPDGFPAPKPVAGVTAEELSAAGNAAGGTLEIRNADETQVWPMLPAEDGERKALKSSNAGVADSTAEVCLTVQAEEGDALAFDFRTSTEPAYDALFVQIDGRKAKFFTGEHDWTTWALPLEAGTHEIVFGYRKDEYSDAGEDCALIANIRTASGSDAAALLKDTPAYPAGETFEAGPATAGARRFVIDDPEGVTISGVTVREGWIIPEDTAVISVTLTKEEDPELVRIASAAGGKLLTECLTPDGKGYEAEIELSGPGTFDCVMVEAGPGAGNAARNKMLVLARDEEGVKAFFEMIRSYGIDLPWHTEDAEAAE